MLKKVTLSKVTPRARPDCRNISRRAWLSRVPSAIYNQFQYSGELLQTITPCSLLLPPCSSRVLPPCFSFFVPSSLFLPSYLMFLVHRSIILVSCYFLIASASLFLSSPSLFFIICSSSLRLCIGFISFTSLLHFLPPSSPNTHPSNTSS